MSLPPKLRAVVDDLASLPPELRIEVLVEYAERVPPLPDRYAEDRSGMEQVTECQTPFFLAAEVDAEGRVTLWFDCAPEAPTTRAFAGILAEGLDGATVDAVLAVPDGFYLEMGLGEAISPLRLRGMDAILRRLKAQVEQQRTDRASGGPAAAVAEHDDADGP
jgi:cysteine desulfuration protein SufE